MRNFFLTLSMLLPVVIFGQRGTIKGVITDEKTQEPVVGATVLIQGSSVGTMTDLDGRYVLSNVLPGSYNIVVKLISYESKIVRVSVAAGQTQEINIKLAAQNIELQTVNVVGMKRVDTETSMLKSIQASPLVTTGISSQQISRSLDRDAAEVVRRIPGITINDGRFVIVRGLTERYNSVWMNGSLAPSMESDVRAFSFDILPSSLIEKIDVIKSPAPELPADFSGAFIHITTKNNAYENKVTVGYTAGYNQFTTGKDFVTYKGSRTDWLGFDRTERVLPAGFPSSEEFSRLRDFGGKTSEQIISDLNTITTLGRSFNKNWNYYTIQAKPDQAFSVSSSKKFLIKNVSIGNISSLNYSNSYTHINKFLAGYQDWDVSRDTASAFYNYNDMIYSNQVRVSGLCNWNIIYGNNQRIEFRNLFNQIGKTQTILRDGFYYDPSINRPAYELSYQSRSVYSGQLSGYNTFNKDNSTLNWTMGYAYANKKMPDLRRVEYLKTPESKIIQIPTSSASPESLCRLFSNNVEKVISGAVNYEQKFSVGELNPSVKTGMYAESKNRYFYIRNIGFAAGWGNTTPLTRLSIDKLMQDTNIYYLNGIKIDEATNKSDSYDAANHLIAGYIGLNVPFLKRFNVYAGIRAENNKRILHGADITKPITVVRDTLNFFPSINFTCNITKEVLFRLAYGVTINRPEFREISPFTFYNFEERWTIYGTPDLKDAHIQNFDGRIEWYPSSGEMVSVGGFYKKFENPIEATLVNAGTGWNFKYQNAIGARNYGIETDIRKSFAAFGDMDNFLRIFRDFSLILNASFIQSKIELDTAVNVNIRDAKRPLQGQSPYVVNAMLVYNNDSSGTMITVTYNIIGKRIAFVGDKENPNAYEMPRNVLDVVLNQRLNKYLSIRMGVRDILQQPYRFIEEETVKINNEYVQRNQISRFWIPSRVFYLALSVNF